MQQQYYFDPGNIAYVLNDSRIFGYSRTGFTDNGVEYPLIVESLANKLGTLDNTLAVSSEGLARRNSAIWKEFNLQSQSGLIKSDDVITLTNAIELIQRPKNFMKELFDFHQENNFRRLIYAPGISDPYLIPALLYVGISVFDDFLPRYESMKGIRYTVLGKEKIEKASAEENSVFANQILDLGRKSILNGTIRDLVEKFSFSSKAIEIIRIADADYYGQMEPHFPSRTQYIMANSVESLYRPDIVRYRERIGQDYRKPREAHVALLLPCSARKPYSLSKSHRRIIEKIQNFRSFVHEIIITSPVGLVPRELEEFYPPAFYDIPVIGRWYEDEKTMINSLISQYFSHNRYESVIAYVNEDLEFIKKSLPDNTLFITGQVTDERNLNILAQTLQGLVNEGRVKYSERRYSDFRNMAAFQFGYWIVPYLENARITRSYNQDMFTMGNRTLMAYNNKLGKFAINRSFAETFIKENRFVVEIDDFKPTANIYAMGVVNATPDIRAEDEVVVSHGGEIRGVGIAKMPFDAMTSVKKGVAVKMR
jgi:archaeosine synthase